MIGKVNAGAGGGVDLHVVGSATRPANPRNNTIWVETSNTITGWELGYKRPETPSEGDVFIFANGATSTADMEISGASGRAGKQIVKVTPSYAYQYINGAWADKPTKFYVNGGWVDTMTTLYDRGTYSSSWASPYWTGSFTSASNHVTVDQSNYGNKTALSTLTVDLTGIQTVQIEYSGYLEAGEGSTSYIEFQIRNAADTSTLTNFSRTCTDNTISIPITTQNINVSSINSSVKLKMYAHGAVNSGRATINIYSIKLIPG